MDGLVAIVVTIVGVIGTVVGIISTYQKNKLQQKQNDLDYIFGKYKETVERVQKEESEDKVQLIALQGDHLHCREEVAMLKERVASQAAEADFLRKRMLAMESRLQALMPGSIPPLSS